MFCGILHVPFHEILQLIIGLIGLVILFRWLDKIGPDPMNYPQDYMG
jgi:hypothetical protein